MKIYKTTKQGKNKIRQQNQIKQNIDKSWESKQQNNSFFYIDMKFNIFYKLNQEICIKNIINNTIKKHNHKTASIIVKST